ncbi:MAG: AAA family ATPase [Nitrososphaeria archaeon]|nr:AAA family ATPase [Nitrososphaeria archaeon]
MRPIKGSAIMVLGVAGVGKTTFGKHLASALNARFLDVPEFVRERGLYSRYNRRSQSYIIDLKRVSIVVGAELRGERAVIASIYAFKPRGVEVEVAIILRMRPTELMRILKERGYSLEKIRENVLAELIDQTLYDAMGRFEVDKIVQLDVTGRDLPKLALDVAEKILGGGVKSLSCEIDWIKTLEEEGGLEDVLGFVEGAKNI